MASAEEIAQTVKTYVELAGQGDADALVALYADDAVVEDPVGGDVHRGRDAIRTFFNAVIDGKHYDTELLSLNVAGQEAAFLFRIIVDARIRIEVIDA